MRLPVDSQRPDPYKNFKFRLRCDGKCVYGGNHLAGVIPFSTGAVFRQGGEIAAPHKLPGRSKFPALTLERGVVLDQSFHNWANQVSRFGANPGSEVSLANFRKDIFLEFYSDAGHLLMTYQLVRCWVSGYKTLPNLGANSNSVAIEHITIEHEGFMMAPGHHP
ncbi:MAG TPA: phage tail protein [Bryobacteraceae bacterium]|nr:phage tail protein [Bryobacteraceae bacterium]